MPRRIVLPASLAVLVSLAIPLTAHADFTTRVDPAKTWGTWEGWGTSLAWWANTFGDRDDVADLVFTSGSTPYGNTLLPGLALNIARYNAGGSSWTPIDGSSMQVSPSIPKFKQIEGYWLNWFSTDPTSSSWNWWVDSKQRTMLWKARDRGANRFELFSNSPMWWMTYNSNPSGAADGNTNLQWWNRQQHAVYLATVARYAHDHWGVDFTSVEPLNEPSAWWWKATGTQEGCHVDLAAQAEVLSNLRLELDRRGLGWMAVAGSDEWGYDDARQTWGSFSSATRAAIGRVNVHGYQYGGGRRDLLYSAVSSAGKGLWTSEYGDGDETGMSLANNLTLDFRWLHPTAWVYWQVLDYGGWGLIQADGSNGWLGPVNAKYFVLAQFTRHIRPGMRIIDGGSEYVVAAYDAVAQRLVVVVTNPGPSQAFTVDLSSFSHVGGVNGQVRRWVTQTGGGESYVRHDDTVLSGKAFSSFSSPNTVQTFEIDDVY